MVVGVLIWKDSYMSSNACWCLLFVLNNLNWIQISPCIVIVYHSTQYWCQSGELRPVKSGKKNANLEIMEDMEDIKIQIFYARQGIQTSSHITIPCPYLIIDHCCGLIVDIIQLLLTIVVATLPSRRCNVISKCFSLRQLCFPDI